MIAKTVKGKTLDITKNEIRFRLESPTGFDSESFRRKKIAEGIFIVVACPDGKFTKNKCKVGMETQSLRFDRCFFTPAAAAKWIDENWTKKEKPS